MATEDHGEFWAHGDEGLFRLELERAGPRRGHTSLAPLQSKYILMLCTVYTFLPCRLRLSLPFYPLVCLHGLIVLGDPYPPFSFLLGDVLHHSLNLLARAAFRLCRAV